jgi:hypothetical protein
MLDFSELPTDGVLFEQLVRELLIRSGFDVHWTGVGPDGEKDLIIIEKAEGCLSAFERRWLVCCKHNATSGTSVGLRDLPNIVDACASVSATGFLLACSSQPTSSVVTRLKELDQAGAVRTRVWDGIEIEKRLRTPSALPLIHIFFPKSSSNVGWTIYNAQSPSFWAGNFKDYFVYLSSRTANQFPDLKEVESILERLERVPLPKPREFDRHYLRPRAVFFDDKHEQFYVFVDYLFQRDDADRMLLPERLNTVLRDGEGLHGDAGVEWYITFWDVRYVETSQQSDHFHVDHKQYYESFLDNFRFGSPRGPLLSDLALH